MNLKTHNIIVVMFLSTFSFLEARDASYWWTSPNFDENYVGNQNKPAVVNASIPSKYLVDNHPFQQDEPQAEVSEVDAEYETDAGSGQAIDRKTPKKFENKLKDPNDNYLDNSESVSIDEDESDEGSGIRIDPEERYPTREEKVRDPHDDNEADGSDFNRPEEDPAGPFTEEGVKEPVDNYNDSGNDVLTEEGSGKAIDLDGDISTVYEETVDTNPKIDSVDEETIYEDSVPDSVTEDLDISQPVYEEFDQIQDNGQNGYFVEDDTDGANGNENQPLEEETEASAVGPVDDMEGSASGEDERTGEVVKPRLIPKDDDAEVPEEDVEEMVNVIDEPEDVKTEEQEIPRTNDETQVDSSEAHDPTHIADNDSYGAVEESAGQTEKTVEHFQRSKEDVPICEFGELPFKLSIKPTPVVEQLGRDSTLLCEVEPINVNDTLPSISLTWYYQKTCRDKEGGICNTTNVELGSESFQPENNNSTYTLSHSLQKLNFNHTGKYICKAETYGCRLNASIDSTPATNSVDVLVYVKPSYGIHIAIISAACIVLLAVLAALLTFAKKRTARLKNRYQELLSSTPLQYNPKLLDMPDKVYNETTTSVRMSAASRSSFSSNEESDLE